MNKYIIPILAYLLILPAVEYLTGDLYLAVVLKTLIVGCILIVFFKQYSELKFKFDYTAIIVGCAIFIAWISLEGFYPKLGESAFNPYEAPGELVYLVLAMRLIGAILIAPMVEELFTRSFLIRYLVSKDFNNVPIGYYTFGSFAVTVLFFGFAHNRWLVGIIAGVLLNWLLYVRKDVGSCVQAHIVANLALAIYVMSTGSWGFW